MGSAQASSVLSGASKDLWEHPGSHLPILNRFGTTFQGMIHSSSIPAQGGLRQNGIPSGKAASKDGDASTLVNLAGGLAGDNPVYDFVKGLRQPGSPVRQVQSDTVNKKFDINPVAEDKINLDSSATGLDKWGKRTHLQQGSKGYTGSRGSSTALPLFNGPSQVSKYK
ncbi:hypothetical protein [Erwinia sp. ErVv1]|uniref:hypothetical protein n=1 Tax=Erwinia sp. ErVv1 TaxID=1603299 RepID=UPI001E630FEB|nr:hypothetical protein [Erwinia sp. ErVv1]